MSFICATLAVILFLVLRFWVPAAGKQRDSLEEQDRRAGYRRQIEADPHNAAAYEELAKSLIRIGRLSEAKEVYGELRGAVSEVERDSVERKLKWLDREIAEQSEQQQTPFGIGRKRVRELAFCPSCQAANRLHARRCATCGEPMLAHSLKDSFLNHWREPSYRNGIRDCAIGIAIIVVLIKICSGLPTQVQFMIFAATMIVCAAGMLSRSK